MNSRLVLSLAVIVAAVVAAVVWFLQSSSTPATAPTLASAPASPAATAPNTQPSWSEISVRPDSGAPIPTLTEKLPPPLPTDPGISEADRKIDEVLRANPDNSEGAHTSTAQMLINLLPTLPPEGQAQAAQHISNLLADKEYPRVRSLVLNPSAPQEVIDVFVTDLMNRDDSVKLPTLLEIAKIPNHPTREEALTDLQIFLDGDFGTDWGKWEASLKAYLAKQRAEAAAIPTAPILQ
jgi:hypothetical protein